MSNSMHEQNGKDATKHCAMIALGSNIGDRVQMIEQACEKMSAQGIIVQRTSLLYETAPMYVTDQDTFYNAVCEVETTLNPHELLDALQSIEHELGRKRIIAKGPRNIDLDIVLYDDQTIADDRLNVPHKLMLERDFVLRPLADLIPQERLPPPHDSETIASHAAALDKKSSEGRPLSITPLAPSLAALKPTSPERRTSVMAILNITPDSFSDGDVHKLHAGNVLKSTIENFLISGTSIIDVGGQSTRPNAKRISPNEELSRILPVIKLIREVAGGSKVAISVDTFYAEVAKAATEAGADIINDVSAGTLDNEMLPTAAKLGKTIIMMHMRGDPSTMGSLTSYPEGVIQGVGQELLDRVKAAEKAGIARWRIILDPGIGFAKTQAQNLELLRRLGDLRNYPGLQGIPWLVGASRKGFIGKITGVKEPHQRIWGTAAAVAASIQGGADVVRVHDVAEMASVVRMADAIYRVKPDETARSVQL
ncbi:hypothetical protein GJ744_004180 [Endocarpon pusillum]|uniref:Folic acid synthesis protein FOL1 n=1 Tax=Endocarpon pusillum TaxID=364733 RepID=A0A8H7AP17_9EURO|nr:hypothetical protein GJ744_004180 [Endocarpon pusillum]